MAMLAHCGRHKKTRHRAGFVFCEASESGGVEGLIQIGDQVVDVLDTDR